jgi:hypothetical protein
LLRFLQHAINQWLQNVGGQYIESGRAAADNKGLASGFNRASLQVSLPSISFVQG